MDSQEIQDQITELQAKFEILKTLYRKDFSFWSQDEIDHYRDKRCLEIEKDLVQVSLLLYRFELVLRKPFKDWSHDEKTIFKNSKYAQKEMDRLQKEKEQLQKEKVQLQKEKVQFRELLILEKKNNLVSDKRETQLIRSQASNDEETQEISPVSDGSAKRQKIDALIEKSKKYLFRTERWGCVTVIKKRSAVTYAHNEHRTLQTGQIIKIYSTETNIEYDVKVKSMNVESDWVVLESAVDLCEKRPIWGPVVDGHRYIQLGLSAPHQEESPFAISTGVIASERPNRLGHTLGSLGANPGDSGGSCFDLSSGLLIGINLGCENVPISLEKDTGAEICDKISSRYAARAHIIPVTSFQFVESIV